MGTFEQSYASGASAQPLIGRTIGADLRRTIALHGVREALVDPRIVAPLRWSFATRARVGPPMEDGRVAIELRGRSVDDLAGELAGWGSLVEVLAPPELRARLATIGRELSAVYA